MTLIMICGAECSGKTTLVNRFKQAGFLEAKLTPAIQTEKDTMQDVNKRVDDTNKQILNCIQDNHVWILDRGFISSQVYAKVFKRTKKNYIRQFCPYKADIMIFYLRPTKEEILSRWSKRSKITNFKSKANEIIDTFDEIVACMKRTGWAIVEINQFK